MGVERRTLVWIATLFLTVAYAQSEGQQTLSATVDGTRMQYVFVTPADFTPGGTYPVLLVLPPAGGSVGDANDALDGYFRAEAQERGWVVIGAVAPYNSTTRLSTLFHLGGEDLIPPLLDLVSEEVAFEGGAVHLAGVSNGGVGAFRVATLHPELVHSVLVIPGSAREEDLARIGNLEGIPVRMYVGENEDPPDMERIMATADALEAAGMASELIVVPGDGHRITSVGGEEIFDWLELQRP
jgi:enterochelin esterase-like enzyme